MVGAISGLHATTVVISQGVNPSVDFNQFLAGPDFREYAEVGWQTGSVAYTNVTISALLEAFDSGGDVLDAFLTNAIGPGAATVATTTGIAVPSGAFSTIALFSGITLAANTDYYLTIAPETGQSANWAVDATFDSGTFTFTQPPLVLDAGVSFLSPPGFCTDDGGNCDDPAPTSGFGDAGLIPVFSVTGLSVPEPSDGILLAGGFVFGILWLHRKRQRS